MNAAVAELKGNNKTVKPMEVTIIGRIDTARRFEKTYFTRFTTPAPDAYSRPQVVEVRSKARLGDVGDEVTVHAKLGGYTRKPYRVTDKDTGETSMVTPVDLTLDAVEG